jgi:hypothetical protein
MIFRPQYQKPLHYFVGHLFRERQMRDLRKAITDVLASTRLEPLFADEQVEAKPLIDKIQDMLSRALFGIYDISGLSPNVMLELGMGLASGNAHYLLKEKATEVPADLAGYEFIEYESIEGLKV